MKYYFPHQQKPEMTNPMSEPVVRRCVAQNCWTVRFGSTGWWSQVSRSFLVHKVILRSWTSKNVWYWLSKTPPIFRPLIYFTRDKLALTGGQHLFLQPILWYLRFINMGKLAGFIAYFFKNSIYFYLLALHRVATCSTWQATIHIGRAVTGQSSVCKVSYIWRALQSKSSLSLESAHSSAVRLCI